MTSTTPPISQPRSRRALLAGALGGIGALAASAIGRVSPVQAATGDPVLVDNAHTGSGITQITTTGITAFKGVSSNADATVIHAHATSADPGTWGILGETESLEGTGVLGTANALTGSSWGVYGEANSAGGIGVVAWNNEGIALRAQGRARFSTSGVATITAGSTLKMIHPGVNILTSSFVLLTPKTNIGSRALWFTTSVLNDTFTIHISSPRSTATKIAWLLLG